MAAVQQWRTNAAEHVRTNPRAGGVVRQHTGQFITHRGRSARAAQLRDWSEHGTVLGRTELVAAEQTAVITAVLEPTSASAPLTIKPLAVTLDVISVDLNPIVRARGTRCA